MAGNAPVTLPRTARWEVRPGGDEARRLDVLVAWPEEPPPPTGHPVLLVLDGPTLFGTAVEAARLQAGRPGATGVAPGVVVGIGHPGARDAWQGARRRDYTPPSGPNAGGPNAGGPNAGGPNAGGTDAGGADALLDALAADVLPAVERRVGLDRGRMALFGHSLAGLVPVHALLTRTGLFARLVAASPSLWWDEGVLMHRARLFAAHAPALPDVRLLLTVGGLERPDTEAAARDPVRAARMERNRMVDNVRDLAACFGPVLPTRCVEFADENHGSVLPAALSRAVAFAFGP